MMPRRCFPAFLAILFPAFQGISSAKPAFPAALQRRVAAAAILPLNFLRNGVAWATELWQENARPRRPARSSPDTAMLR